MRGLLAAAALTLSALALGMAVSSCSKGGGKPDFTIVAGSENKTLEPIVQAFCQKNHKTCAMRYEGSLDIGMATAPGQTPDADAVWPAASLWIDLYDKDRQVRDLHSISQSPVILGVRESQARQLGWIGAKVSSADIVAAVKAGKLKFLMTSATQSNSGASAYLAMLAALVGAPDVIEAKDLDDPGLQAKVKTLLSGVERSSGSSGWLKDLFLKGRPDGSGYQAMWNYEAVIKETNDELAKTGGEKLYAIYPSDGVFVADSPLGFVDHKRGPETETFFKALQAYLLSADVQAQIAQSGRRVALGAAAPAKAEPDWNFNPSKTVTSVRVPDPDVIRAALGLYQNALRRPSLTAFCLDFSGSMQGDGVDQVKSAMSLLLTEEKASEDFIQWTKQDKIYVIPFDDKILGESSGTATTDTQARLLGDVMARQADGGTYMHQCLTDALARVRADPDFKTSLPAIVVMTDGRSDDAVDDFKQAWESGPPVPVFAVTFGDADDTQLKTVTELTQGRIIDGRTNLVEAFRATRGYN